MNPKIGRKATCVITNFTGIVTGYVQFISGCNQCLITPPAKPDGTGQGEPCWIDERRLQFADDPAIVLDNGKNPGFDKAPPTR
jgi:hypothetical protein